MSTDTTAARLTTDEQTARRIASFLAESLDAGEAACAAFENEHGQWEIAVHMQGTANEIRLRDLVRVAAGDEAALALRFEAVNDTDWVRQSLEGLKPVRAGRFVVHGSHDRSRVRSNDLGIEIEAALAFGTGHHGTTRGCLSLLDHVLKSRKPRRVLDLGTGTGVLAIAAAKAQRRAVLASDIDAPSVKVARENARLNGSGPLVQVIRATGFAAPEFSRHAPFDLVLANILANPLKQLAGPMSGHLAPKGYVILSGLLNHQAAAVVAAYRARGLVPLRHIRIEGWSSLLLQAVG